MLYKRFRKEKRKGAFLPILIPVMNLFLLILPFVIQNAFLQKIASMELQLPSISEGVAQKTEASKDIIIEIKKDGFTLFWGDEKKLEKDFKDNYGPVLEEKLMEIKRLAPQKQDLMIKVDPAVQYEKVVSVMDIAKSEGKLFPNIVFYDEVK
ncbi:MAG: biopolymer transporter ExbD [Proteobacteria bacterium]|nr:biopolymer transporter ExbD [Pseudomonadota bacterium]